MYGREARIVQMSYEVFHRDVRTLVNFYVGVLSFQRSEADMTSDYVVLRRDNVRVGCCFHNEANSSPRRPPNGSEIVFRVDDIQAEYDHVFSSGWPIADPLQNQPWGLTDFRIFDPTGQYLRVTNATAGD
jgi:predicted enzyme related to lactoylglutathione lyase